MSLLSFASAGRAAGPARVLFSGHDFKFLSPFIERCRANPLYEVRLETQKTHHLEAEDEARANLAWADIIFCEWALGNAVWYSRHKRPGQLLAVRLHLQEVQDRDRIRFIYDIDWSRVDRLVLITQRIYDWMIAEFPILRDRACLIYNPIDARGALTRPKSPGSEFNLGMVGIVPRRKRFDLAMEIWEKLVRRDDRFRLFIKGSRPEDYSWMRSRTDEMAWYHEVYARIARTPTPDGVIFEPHGSDMADWYAKIGFLLSTSDFEGSHQAVAEAMAAGGIPVIRNWEGADRIYPPKYMVRTTDEAADAIVAWQAPERLAAEQSYCRAYAAERFDQGEICDKLESMFLGHLRQSRPQLVQESPQVRHAAATLPPVLILGYVAAGYRGGYRIRIEQEIKALVRLGCVVHFACLHPPADETALAMHRETLAQLGCSVHLIACPRFFDLKADAALFAPELKTLGRLMEENHIQILHAEALYSTYFALLLKRQRPEVRLVFDAHGVTPEEERLGGSHASRVTTTENWETAVLAESDLNVFVSEAMSSYYDKKYDVVRAPHALVPCCVADERFPDPAATSPLALPQDRPILTYLGTMAAWQCGEEMVRLFAALHARRPDLFFALLVPSGDHATTRRMMEEHGLPAASVLLAEAPHDQVAACLQGAHAGFLLRRRHPVNLVSSPTKFGEYLAAGCPVVMTDRVGDFSALATREQVGLVVEHGWMDQPRIPDALLNRVLAFVDLSRAQRETMGRRCRNVAWQAIHWEPAIERLAAAYRTMLLASDNATAE